MATETRILIAPQYKLLLVANSCQAWVPNMFPSPKPVEPSLKYADLPSQSSFPAACTEFLILFILKTIALLIPSNHGGPQERRRRYPLEGGPL